jgi:hypothetical protein
LLFSVLSVLSVGVAEFLRSFDPMPLTSDPQAKYWLLGMWVASVVLCYVGVLVVCVFFNLLARITGGIRYRTTSDT